MMTYEQRAKVFYEEYEVTGLSLQDRVALFNLVGVIYVNANKKDPKVTVYEVASKVIKTFTDTKTNPDYFLVPFSIQLDSLIKNCDFVPNSLGFKSAKEIVDEINVIMDRWLPF